MYAMAKGLTEYREERYMSVDEFVQLLGISTRTLYTILKGKRPRLTTMRRIAEKLGVHPTDIEEFAPRPPAAEK